LFHFCFSPIVDLFFGNPDFAEAVSRLRDLLPMHPKVRGLYFLICRQEKIEYETKLVEKAASSNHFFSNLQID